MKKATITLYTHFFKVTKMHPSMYNVARQALKELTQMRIYKVRGRIKKEGFKVYAARNVNTGELRFHINYLPRFKELMFNAYIRDEEIEYITEELYDSEESNLKVDEKYVMRDYQVENINYVLDEGYSKLITLQTGFGKGITAMKAAEMVNKKVLVIVLARYMEKWRDEMEEVFGDSMKLHIVQGLQDLIRMGMEPEVYKDFNVYLVSSTVMRMYTDEWEKHAGKEIDGMVSPEDLYKNLNVGLRIIDEAHQHFHFVFKNDLYTHCAKTIYLTATLETNDRFVKSMYETLWPTPKRLPKMKYNAYDRTLALLYDHYNVYKVKTERAQGYNHAMYEQQLLNNYTTKYQYFDLIGNQVEKFYLPLYKKGRRMLIFCSLVETCELLADYLKRRFKKQKWNISKFTAGDPLEIIIEQNDITISTLGKAGTALDVPGLIITYMTVALSEPKANLQAKGRNRDLSKKPGFEDITPLFLYHVAIDIPKHVSYHKEKKFLFDGRTKEHLERQVFSGLGQPMFQYTRDFLEDRWSWYGVDKKGIEKIRRLEERRGQI